jgi:hypothetical protein
MDTCVIYNSVAGRHRARERMRRFKEAWTAQPSEDLEPQAPWHTHARIGHIIGRKICLTRMS